MRAMVGVRRRPPGTAVADPLMDVLVHGQDIAMPLGVERTMPIPAAVIVAERVWTMGFPFNARKRFPNVDIHCDRRGFQRRRRGSGPRADPGHRHDVVGPCAAGLPVGIAAPRRRV